MQRYCYTRDRKRKFHPTVRLSKPQEERSCFINECRKHGFIKLHDSINKEHKD